MCDTQTDHPRGLGPCLPPSHVCGPPRRLCATPSEGSAHAASRGRTGDYGGGQPRVGSSEHTGYTVRNTWHRMCGSGACGCGCGCGCMRCGGRDLRRGGFPVHSSQHWPSASPAVPDTSTACGSPSTWVPLIPGLRPFVRPDHDDGCILVVGGGYLPLVSGGGDTDIVAVGALLRHQRLGRASAD